MRETEKNAAQMPGLMPENWYVEGLGAQVEQRSAAVYKQEAQELEDAFRQVEGRIKASTILMATVCALMFLEQLGSGSTTADWYASSVRSINNVVKDNFNISFSGTLILNGLLRVADRLKLNNISWKLLNLRKNLESHGQ